MARFRLIPREESFYAEFVAMADEIRTAARLLEEMLKPDRPIWDKADEIKAVEHRCDVLTRDVIQRLHRTFVTPIDREDIHALAGALDDVVDAIDNAAVLVRPDMTRFIADALAEVEEDDFRQKLLALGPTAYKSPIGEKEFMAIWLKLQDLRLFFEAAAENLEAVVFTAKYQE